MGGMALIRAAGVRGLDGLVRDHGGDPVDMARRAGLPAQALHDDDLLVDDVALGTVLEIAAAELALPDLGLLLSQRQDLTMLGALSVAIQNSPTVGDALECTSRYLFIHSRGLSVEVVPDPRGAAGVVGIRYGQAGLGDVFRQGLDVGLGFLHRSSLYLSSGSYGLRGVELPHRPLAPVSRYEEFFAAPVSTGRDAAVLRVPTSLLAQPIDAANQAARRLALEHLEIQARESGRDVETRVRSALEQSLGTTRVHVDDVAGLLAVHPRTLQRRLEDEGTSFGAILDRLRAARAQSYLTTTDMPMSQVAAALGLSEQSALSRSCRRWWGRTPSQVRRSGQSDGVAR
jgi:AraC-like DNA-binding protein